MTSGKLELQAAISRNVMRLMDDWNISSKDIICLLALPDNTRVRHLEKYRSGEPFPNDPGTQERIEQIAGIADALRTMYPRNAHMAPRWLRTPNRRMDNQAPVQVMVSQGLQGLLRVRSEIDCTFAWDQSGSVHT